MPSSIRGKRRRSFCSFDQRGDLGPVSSPRIEACEEGVLAVQRDGAEDAFEGVVVNLDTVIRKEAAKSVAVFGDIGERFARRRNSDVPLPSSRLRADCF